MTLEHVSSLQSSLQEGTASINIPSSDVNGLYTCLTKALCLLGSFNSQASLERRKQILEKLNTKLTSLANEPLPDAGKLLFGPSFEEMIKQRNETAKIISAASARKPTQQFFRRGASSNYRPWREAKNVVGGTTKLLIPEGGIHSELWVEAEEDFKVSNHNQTKILSDWAAQSGNKYVQSSNQFSTTLPQYSVGKVRASPGEFKPDAPSRPSETFCDKLGVRYQRPVCAQCNFGLSNLFHRTPGPLPKYRTKYDIFGQGSRVNKQRAGRLDTKTSNSVCTIKSGYKLCQHNFCDSQKRWVANTAITTISKWRAYIC